MGYWWLAASKDLTKAQRRLSLTFAKFGGRHYPLKRGLEKGVGGLAGYNLWLSRTKRFGRGSFEACNILKHFVNIKRAFCVKKVLAFRNKRGIILVSGEGVAESVVI